MQKAYNSMNISFGFIILFFIIDLMKTETSLTILFWRFFSFLLSSHYMMQLVMYKVRNSLGSSTAFANLFISSNELRLNSILTNFSKYLKFNFF